MNKILLTICFALTIIFSACEKEEENINNNTNNNTNVDPIIGDWISFGSEWAGSQPILNNPYDDNITHQRDFFSNYTWEDYLMVNGVKSEDYFGTWENVGNGVYFLDDDHDASNVITTFFCSDFEGENNVMKQQYIDDSDGYIYLQKVGYYYEDCDDFN